jgi:hypothetical protein
MSVLVMTPRMPFSNPGSVSLVSASWPDKRLAKQ